MLWCGTSLTHDHKIEYKYHIFRVKGIPSQGCPIVDWIKDHRGYVCPVICNYPLLASDGESLYLKEFRDVVEDGKEHDWNDVAKSITHLIIRMNILSFV